MIVEQLNRVCVLHDTVNLSQAIQSDTVCCQLCHLAPTKHHVIVGHSRKLGLTLCRLLIRLFDSYVFWQSHLVLVDDDDDNDDALHLKCAMHEDI